MSYFIGLDISKGSIDVCFLEEKERSYARYTNDAEGHDKLVTSLKDKEIKLVVVEPTGGYEKAVCDTLISHSYRIHRVNTFTFSKFAQSIHLSKTDRLDAYKLALYGQKFSPKEMACLGNEELKALQQRREDLVTMLGNEKRRREHAQGHVLSSIESHIEDLHDRISELDQEIARIIQADESLRASEEILISTPGIGRCLASKLLSHLPELGHAGYDVKQLAALVGVAPYARDSGKQCGYRFIRGGRKIPRDSLYIAVITGRKSIPFINDLYERLIAKAKPKKVAIVACMRRLLGLLHTLLKQNRLYQKGYGKEMESQTQEDTPKRDNLLLSEDAGKMSRPHGVRPEGCLDIL